MAVPECEVVSLFKLAEDFGLAEHHRVQPTRDFEQVLQALRFGQRVEFIVERDFRRAELCDAQIVRLNSLAPALSSLRRGRRILRMDVSLRFTCLGETVECRQKILQLNKRPGGFQRGRGVNFHPVAR